MGGALPVNLVGDFIAQGAKVEPLHQVLASAKQELGERVYMDKMAQARRAWLDNLRRQQHVDVRL